MNINTTFSMSEKLRRMCDRARSWTSRDKYSTADVIRWLGTTEKNLKNLVYCLNCRESLGITFEGKALRFETGI